MMNTKTVLLIAKEIAKEQLLIANLIEKLAFW